MLFEIDKMYSADELLELLATAPPGLTFKFAGIGWSKPSGTSPQGETSTNRRRDENIMVSGRVMTLDEVALSSEASREVLARMEPGGDLAGIGQETAALDATTASADVARTADEILEQGKAPAPAKVATEAPPLIKKTRQERKDAAISKRGRRARQGNLEGAWLFVLRAMRSLKAKGNLAPSAPEIEKFLTENNVRHLKTTTISPTLTHLRQVELVDRANTSIPYRHKLSAIGEQCLERNDARKRSARHLSPNDTLRH